MGVLSQTVDYRVFDADNHYYEPVDLFMRYIDPAYRDRTFTVEERDGGTAVLFRGQPFGFVGGSGNKQRIRPGALRAMLRGETLDEGDEDDSYASDPAARIAMMDRQGIEATLMFPSTGVTIANAIGRDPELRAAHMRAFNRWLSESWTFDYQNRIFSPAVIDLADPEAAVAELDTVLGLGARAIQLLPGPALWSTPDTPGRSPADPVHDGFWTRVNEAGVLVTLHLGNSGYMEHYSTDWGEDPDPDGIRSNDGLGTTSLKGPDGRGKGRSAFQWTMLYRDRPIMDTLAILIYHNLFGRFPNVQVMSVENGAIWVPYLLRAMDNMKGMGRNGPWPNGYVVGKPSEVFRRHVYVSPHHYGEDVAELVDLLGADRVLFGSDFPHAEGMSGIGDYQERTGEFAAKLRRSADVTRQVLRDNGLAVVGL
ncbi:MAG TPA: amidohydrolase family protein [Acidimicrobiales bacterium]|nr:amidohydrolase family protein [Acidimicrobiales bacterium]